MEKPVFEQTEDNKEFNRFSIPVKWGILIGIASCILSTVNFMYVINSNYIVFLILSFLIPALTVVFCAVAGGQQRKAIGGYIDLKQAFQAIFVALLIASLISATYGVVYAKFIDPNVTERVREATIDFMTRMKAPQDKIDDAARKFDSGLADSMKPSVLIFSFAKSLVLSSIFGFICALIVRKKKPLI